ncbi:RidA family protein [Pantoea phytobeneficialis]|uniref:Enamine deaminase RidA n=1 Tax=Pantoea phytobeneficialis TaxID=2052056 RepID=A0AAP9KP95_9GAMM|nr:RidA family protein [Pantoea phytobeneficialis]MDO6405686.1 RidA family protein [Pantoea phytobeneficialis]QGR06674.1 enamine deaminase RidA [Pantoea phytobeneficialis]
MSRRESIYIDAFPHTNPIPAACRIGAMLYSGVIYGRDPQTQQVPADLGEQCALMFSHIESIVKAAGGTLEDVIKVTLWMQDKSQREVVNRYWLATFPDANARPARHALDGNFSGNTLIQCDFIAVLDR